MLFQDNRPETLFSGNLSQWQTHISGDFNSSEGDPLLDSSYHLTPASPCIDAGSQVSGFSDDYDGVKRTAIFDTGADEFNAASGLAVPPSQDVTGTGALNNNDGDNVIGDDDNTNTDSDGDGSSDTGNGKAAGETTHSGDSSGCYISTSCGI